MKLFIPCYDTAAFICGGEDVDDFFSGTSAGSSVFPAVSPDSPDSVKAWVVSVLCGVSPGVLHAAMEIMRVTKRNNDIKRFIDEPPWLCRFRLRNMAINKNGAMFSDSCNCLYYNIILLSARMSSSQKSGQMNGASWGALS